ncbi:MAG: SIMPL domain-containing protein [Algibacter sp.]|uniref:SIMPL domain-containing protein n=1 Tax=Algibacter sp. TaxID=1872428 RepID=UPI00261821BD|nr:SIMPL domain-containing protein [Algibacter sp.]MDG1729670.1 SIMPL domain-containing protein [Algibacter sp.]MDG2178941.1 SIMPL domain-containing protein [Algibacter sp.]
MKKNLSAIIFGITIISASLILGNAIINRNKKAGTISVTGLGKTNFTSDLIVWEASFSQVNRDLKEAYADLKKDKETISEYLKSKGLSDDVIVFTAVTTSKNMKQNYSSDGKYLGQEFTGFTLNQTVQINSKEVEKVEKISREVTELLNKGIQLYSMSPRYYYTKLEDLKIEMISRSTDNARLRAESISENSGASLGELIIANMGIFQITGQNSNEDYSWGGAYNTTSKEKTASITMKLTYAVK